MKALRLVWVPFSHRSGQPWTTKRGLQRRVTTVVFLAAWLGATPASAQVSGASIPAGLIPPPTLEERLRELEREVRELRLLVPPKDGSTAALTPASPELAAAAPAGPAEPFAWGDFTWVNGASRQTSHLIDSKYFTPQLDIDLGAIGTRSKLSSHR